MSLVSGELVERWQEAVDRFVEYREQQRDLRCLLTRIEDAIRWQTESAKREAKIYTPQHWRRLGAIAARRKIAAELREILKLEPKEMRQ